MLTIYYSLIVNALNNVEKWNLNVWPLFMFLKVHSSRLRLFFIKNTVKSCHNYLYSASLNTDCFKAASQWWEENDIFQLLFS